MTTITPVPAAHRRAILRDQIAQAHRAIAEGVIAEQQAKEATAAAIRTFHALRAELAALEVTA